MRMYANGRKISKKGKGKRRFRSAETTKFKIKNSIVLVKRSKMERSLIVHLTGQVLLMEYFKGYFQ